MPSWQPEEGDKTNPRLKKPLLGPGGHWTELVSAYQRPQFFLQTDGTRRYWQVDCTHTSSISCFWWRQGHVSCPTRRSILSTTMSCWKFSVDLSSLEWFCSCLSDQTQMNGRVCNVSASLEVLCLDGSCSCFFVDRTNIIRLLMRISSSLLLPARSRVDCSHICWCSSSTVAQYKQDRVYLSRHNWLQQLTSWC